MALKFKFYLKVSCESERQNGFQSTEVLTSFEEKEPAQSFKIKESYKLELTQNLMNKTKFFLEIKAILLLLRNR